MLRFTFRSFAGIPSDSCFRFAFRKTKQTAVLSQFLHSLNVNPCTPTCDKYDAKKFLMAAHNTPCTVKVNIFCSYRWRNFCVCRLERLLQNLTPNGGVVKKFKFLKEVKFLSNFVHSTLHAQCNLRQAEGGHQKFRHRSKRKK